MVIERAWRALVLVAVLAVLPVAQAHAAPPNDDFADAQVVSGALPQSVDTTNDLATKEPGEPDHAGNSDGHSVWFSWTPSASGPVVIDTCSHTSLVNTVLGVYTGDAVDALAEIASNDDDNCGYYASRVRFTASAGTTYRIAVDSARGRWTTDITLRIRAQATPPSGCRSTFAAVAGSMYLIAVARATGSFTLRLDQE